MTRNPVTVGAHVLVQLYDGRIFLGIVKAVHDTVSGRKVAVQHQQMAWRLDAEQILRTVRKPKPLPSPHLPPPKPGPGPITIPPSPDNPPRKPKGKTLVSPSFSGGAR